MVERGSGEMLWTVVVTPAAPLPPVEPASSRKLVAIMESCSEVVEGEVVPPMLVLFSAPTTFLPSGVISGAVVKFGMKPTFIGRGKERGKIPPVVAGVPCGVWIRELEGKRKARECHLAF